METTEGQVEIRLNDVSRGFRTRQSTAWVPLVSGAILIGLAIWIETLQIMHDIATDNTTILNLALFIVGVLTAISSLWCEVC